MQTRYRVVLVRPKAAVYNVTGPKELNWFKREERRIEDSAGK